MTLQKYHAGGPQFDFYRVDFAGFAGPISVEVLNKDLRKRPLSEVARLTFSRSKAALERARGSAPSAGVG